MGPARLLAWLPSTTRGAAMKHRPILAALLAATALALVGSQAAFAGPGHGSGHGLVFVQTNELTGNQIAVFHRGGDGQLTPAGRYSTGGVGGATLGGDSDHLASQGSLVF